MISILHFIKSPSALSNMDVFGYMENILNIKKENKKKTDISQIKSLESLIFRFQILLQDAFKRSFWFGRLHFPIASR